MLFKMDRSKRAGLVCPAGLLLFSSVGLATMPPGYFTNAKPVSGVNTASSEMTPFISADNLTLYFISNRPATGGAGNSDIYQATRGSESESFGNVTSLGAAVNSSDNEWLGSVAPDGLTIYFSSGGAAGVSALYKATRTSTGELFGNKEVISSDTPYSDYCPSISTDSLTLFFESSKPGQGSHDIWMTTRNTTDEPFGPAENLGLPVNTGVFESIPRISADGLALLFCDWPYNVFATDYRPGGVGQSDVWIATRTSTDEPFGEVTNLGTPVNSTSQDIGAAFSADWPATGSKIYFCTNRDGWLNADIWEATWFRENVPPVAVVAVNPMKGRIILTVNFDGSGSYDPDGTIVGYEWDFDNDGAVDATGPMTSHDYTEAGIYIATLTVTDNDDETGATSVEIEVAGQAGDFDDDGDVDGDDAAAFLACSSGPTVLLTAGCEGKDLDGDDDVDQSDFAILQRCYSGPDNPADPNCTH